MFALPLKYSALFAKVYSICTAKITLGRSLEILTILHAFSLALSLKRSQKQNGNIFPLQLIFTVCVIGFAGNSFLAMALAQPMKWFNEPFSLGVFALVALKVFYFPNDLIFTSMEAVSCFLCPFLCLVDCAYDALCATRAIDTAFAQTKGQSQLMSLLIAGVLSCKGGAILASMFNLKSSNWKFQIPEQFQHPLQHFQRPFIISLAYSLLVTFGKTKEIQHSVSQGMIVVLSIGLCVICYLMKGCCLLGCGGAASCCVKKTSKSSSECKECYSSLCNSTHSSSSQSCDSPVVSSASKKQQRPSTPIKRILRTRASAAE